MRDPGPTYLLLPLSFLFSSASFAQVQKDDSLPKKMLADTLEKQQPVAMPKELTEEDLLMFTKVDKAAKVDMGQWRRHLEINLLSPIVNGAKQGIKAGYYMISVRFLVEKDGSLTGIKALNDPGYGLAETSEKVVKTSPKWSPVSKMAERFALFIPNP